MCWLRGGRDRGAGEDIFCFVGIKCMGKEREDVIDCNVKLRSGELSDLGHRRKGGDGGRRGKRYGS